MKEYRKIPNLFLFDDKYRNIIGFNTPFLELQNLTWLGTEKVDGANIRVCYDGHRITLLGRTDNAQFQGDSEKYLSDLFCTQEMEYIFEQNFENKEVIIFGEVYGAKIQTGGGNYSPTPKFIVFDIDIDGYHLARENVVDICHKLGLDYVPIVFRGTLTEAIDYVKEHQVSTLNENHEMEGIVLELPFAVYDKNGEKIKCKCKYRDIVKGGLHE